MNWADALGGYLSGLMTAASAVGVLAWRVKRRLATPTTDSDTQVKGITVDLSQFTVRPGGGDDYNIVRGED